MRGKATTIPRPRPGAPPARLVAGIAVVAALLLSMLGAAGPASAQGAGQSATGPVVAVDEQQWSDQADMTWDDYVPIRPDEWNSAETSEGEIAWTSAIILLEFEDQPMLITQDEETHAFGNPQSGWEPVAREDINQWYTDYFTNPDNAYNGGQTLHSYWMENTHGRIGVRVDVFGPYTLNGKLHEYGLSGFGRPVGNQANSVCPAEDTCTGRNLRAEGTALWRADIGCPSNPCGYNSGFIVTAGHDESSTWQEFGEMVFRTQDDVPAAFGPPGAEDGPVLNSAGNPITNWAGTRYVPWTSWRAAANHWPAAGFPTTQAESSGQSVFAHELSHVLSLPDNYNNPYAPPNQLVRNYSGYWEMMSRGTFNGPGGTHNRWQVPNAGGSALGPHHMLHFKTSGNQRLGVLEDDEHTELGRHDLVDDGIAVLPLKARSYVPDGDQVGLTVNLGAGGFSQGACLGRVEENPSFWCHTSVSNWQRFTLEVVDRVGNDSFTAGHGVLLAQTRNSGTPRVWLVDANPADIDRVDFYRPGNDEEPGGEPVMVTPGDPRQLDDATFHAGALSGSEFEYLDEPNNLHFYILDAYRDRDGVLYYDVAVRNTNGAGDFDRDASLGGAATYAVGGSTALVRVPLTNTGEAGEGINASDVYRISAEVDVAGWDVHLPYEVTAAQAGGTVPVSVYASAGGGATGQATVSVTVTSEADPSATATVEVEVSTADLAVSFAGIRELLDVYRADGLLETNEYNRIRAQVDTAERLRNPQARAQAISRIVRFAEDVADTGARNLASAALVSIANEL